MNKAASIQRAIKRARQEVDLAGGDFANDYTRQDAAMLNLLRACESAIDLANHIIRKEKLGLPASSRESFTLLVAAGRIPERMGKSLEKMVAFRNLAVHEYARLEINRVESLIREELGDLADFSRRFLSS
ncbi:MAG: DUF86 domain-containing protein [bacterium]|nr:DUF86 domain-containing protein [bacterium]